MTDVYLELGTRRTFAVAVEWPGWSRAGRDEDAALAALADYAPRYVKALGAGAHAPDVPVSVADLHVVERLAGGAATDFGAPEAIPLVDQRPVDGDDLERLVAIHRACWDAFQAAQRLAAGRELRPSGPRGGGRSVAKMADHVGGAEAGYLRRIGGRVDDWSDPTVVRDAFAAQLRERAAGGVPDEGPRGGKRWPARYAARRSCWHLLDHAWEIEDRLTA